MTRLFESEADRDRALRGVLAEVDIPGLPSPQVGKVRQAYDLDERRRLMVATDRLSAFDLQITTVPYKGQVLTELSRFWFERTAAICPNHLVAVPDPNVTVCRRLRMLPVEVVVRGYLAGTTSTSLLTMYQAGVRTLYGTTFPDGMRPNQRLAAPVITPTTKGDAGAHDAPLGMGDVAALGLVDSGIWAKVCERALALFAFGQAHAARAGLILVDTKYEFGLDEAGEVVIADEIHTPDSSRYWDAASYEERFTAGQPPEAFDKDKVRRWVSTRCDPYRDAIPPIPDALRIETAEIYATLYERLTGSSLTLPAGDVPAAERVAAALAGWMRT